MSRFFVTVCTALAGVGLVSACGSPPAAGSTPAAASDTSCAQVFRLLGLGPAAIASAKQQQLCQPQDLTLTGDVSASVESGYLRTAAGSCVTPTYGTAWQLPELDFAIAQRVYELDLMPSGGYSDAQARSGLNQSSISLVSGGRQYWAARSGTITVNDDGVSGRISADFQRDVAGAAPIHVTGGWTCGARHAFAAADPSIPCGQYYANAGLNQAESTNLVRSCLPQGLSLSGQLDFTVDHGINDPDHAGSPLDSPPLNLCEAEGRSYYASVAFSHRRETFVLALGVRSTSPYTDPAFGPGIFQVPAALNLSPEPEAELTLASPSASGLTLLDGPAQSWPALSGSFTVGADYHSGTVDLVLGSEGAGQVRLIGSWRCA